MRTLTPWILLAAALAFPAGHAPAAEPAWKPELLPREREMAAALAAGPASIAGSAGVYVLTQQGFALARQSRDGFHCLVARDLPGAFEPQCFDAEGSETLLKATLLAAELRMKGDGERAIKDAIAEAYAAGRLRAPRRAGINYMLSTENRVPVDAAGTVKPYRPHVMIYAPYLKNADFGVDPAGQPPVFVINEGAPGAYLIVPVSADAPHAHAGGSRPTVDP